MMLLLRICSRSSVVLLDMFVENQSRIIFFCLLLSYHLSTSRDANVALNERDSSSFVLLSNLFFVNYFR